MWWLGPERSAAFDDGATGGIGAITLLAHALAAAKVRRQSLQIHSGSYELLPELRFLKSSVCLYCLGEAEIAIESAEADDAEPMSSTNSPSVVDAAIN